MGTIRARCSFPGDCVPLPVLHSVAMTTAEHISVTAVSLVSPFSFCHSPFSLSLLALFHFVSLSISRSPSLIKMRLRQSSGGGEIAPYLRERERLARRKVTRKLYFTVGCVGIGAFITFMGVVLNV